jgi:hypothetical protein
MNSRVILSISPEGKLKVFLQGEGKAREKMLRAFGKYVESDLPRMEHSISNALRRVYEDTNFDLNQC